MTTYFHQSYMQYSGDAKPSASENLIFLNSALATNGPMSHLTHAPLQLVGIPLPTNTSSSQDHQNLNVAHEISQLHGMIPLVQCNLWNPIDQSALGRETPHGSGHSQRGALSLSLSSHSHSQQPLGFRSFKGEHDREISPSQPVGSGGGGVAGGSPSSALGVTSNCGRGVSGIQGMPLSTKYLKVAQELLDEVVKVDSGTNKPDAALKKPSGDGKLKAAGETSSSGTAAAGKEESKAAEFSTAESQEIQMKKTKLLNMLDAVDQRYRQYYHQMQIVISLFEQSAGIGSAQTYTAIALKTISKQFRCLKDAIMGQIKSVNKSLGEDDSPGGTIKGSRLKFVDHQIRQQRALQQLGMIQHNAWRPQRGLPERSVSILRAWLFEHFLHPYPKDSDKVMLAKQTGLTRSQVSNWFINARVRLWKPMVEEMYLEEVKDQNHSGNDEQPESKTIDPDEDLASKLSSSPQDRGHSSENISSKSLKSKETDSMTREAPAILTNSVSLIGESLRVPPGFSLIGQSEQDGITQVSPKKLRIAEMLHSSHNRAESRNGYLIMGGPTNFIGGFGQCPMGEIGPFGAEQFVPSPTFPGNGVSLTLGLLHNENLSLSIDHPNQAFLSNQNFHLGRRVEVGEGNDFGTINGVIPSPLFHSLQHHRHSEP